MNTSSLVEYISIMLKCKYEQCDFTAWSAGAMASHVLWTHKTIESVHCDRCNRTVLVTQKARHDAACLKRNACKGCGALTRNRNFCSNSCAASFNNTAKKIGFSAWRKKHGIIAQKTYSDVCLEHWEPKCAICGWDLCIEVHHIDRNRMNNEPQNLIPLCPNHHKLTQKREHKAVIDAAVNDLVKQRFSAPIT